MSQTPLPPVQPGYQAPYPGANKPAGMAIASMVLGIVSIVLVCLWYISIPCAIVAIVLGYIAKGKIARGEAGGSGMATTGLILGIIAIALIIIILILAAVGLSILGSKAKEIQDEIKRQQQQNGTGGAAPSQMFHLHISALWNIFTTLVLR